MNSYIDTSSLVKIYHSEAGSSIVLGIYHSEQDIIISELSKIECLCLVIWSRVKVFNCSFRNPLCVVP